MRVLIVGGGGQLVNAAAFTNVEGAESNGDDGLASQLLWRSEPCGCCEQESGWIQLRRGSTPPPYGARNTVC